MTENRQRRWREAALYRNDLLRFARRHTGCREDAEDAVSEAILRAGLTENLDEDRMWPWLVAVTIRICVDQHRRRPRPEHLGRIYAREVMDEPAVDEAVCARDEARFAARVVDRLPVRQRLVLRLRADGVPAPEIAEKLDTSYKTVESLTSRGRTSVRAALATTLAALLGYLRRLPRRPRPVAVAAPVMVVAAIVGLVHHGPVGSTAEVTLPVVGPGHVWTVRDVHGPASGPEASAESGRWDRSGVLGRAPVPGLQRRPGPGVRTDVPLVPDVTIQTYYIDTGRSLVEEIQHCIEAGPQIESGQYGCKP